MIVKKTLVAAAAAGLLALLGGVGIQAGSVSLPEQAADQATEATTEVTLPAGSEKSSETATSESQGAENADEHAAFGQCAAANAKTASENAGSEWNPTDGCENTNRSAGAAVAAEHANENGSTGLDAAQSAKANGESHRAGR